MPPRVLAASTHKGGIGKTTTTVNVARVLARDHGRRVLLCDLDPQGNASDHLGLKVPREALHTPAGLVLLGAAHPAEVAVAAFGFDVLPGGLPTAVAASTLDAHPARLGLLGTLLAEGPWDVVLLDTPPGHGAVLQAALRASHGVLAPLVGRYYSLSGLRDMVETVEAEQRAAPQLEGVVGWFLTDTKMRTVLAQHVQAAARSLLPKAELATIIREDVRLAEAPAHRRPVLDHAPDCNGSKDYLALTRELMDRGIL